MKTWKHASLWTSLLAAMMLGSGGCDFGDPVNHASGGGTSIDGLTGNLVIMGGSPAADAMVRVFSAGGSSGALAKSAGTSEDFETSAFDSVPTNSEGRFQFKNLPNGTYNLTATLSLADNTVLALYLQGIVVDGNTNLGVDTLQLTGNIVLQVRGTGNAPVPGALCAIAGGIWQVSSDSSGACTLSGVPPGTFQATVNHPSYLTATSADVTVTGGASTSGVVVILISTATPLPAMPTLVSPAQSASDVGNSPTLIWNPAEGATSYQVQVSFDPAFSNFAVNDSSLTVTSRMVTGLAAGVEYFWRVRAWNAEGTGPYSETFRFTTTIPPDMPSPVPTLISPAANATGVSVTGPLSWSPAMVQNPGGYRVQVATDPEFLQIVRDTFVANPGVSFTNSPLASNTVYFWRANTLILLPSGTSDWSPYRKFTTAASVPAAPTLTYPLSGAADVPTTPTFTWNPVSGATAYHLEVVGSDFIAIPLVNDSTLTGTSRAGGPLQYLVTYGWRVRARNAAGWGPWSATNTIFRDEVPGPTLTAPQLASPATGAIGVSLGSALTWSAVTGATSYRVQVSTSPDFSTFDLNDTNATTSRSTALLNFSTTYYWRVHARNAAGTGDWSEVRTFTTAPFVDVVLLSAPILSAPPDTAMFVEPILTLTWGAVTGAMTYQVQLSTSADFMSMFVNDSNLMATSRTVGPLVLGTKYYWRVRGMSPSAIGNWSAVRSFTTAAPTSGSATWTTRTSGITATLRAVTWTGTQYVAVGDGGTILTSPDGMIWSARSSGTTADLYAVAWTGSLLVAGGDEGDGLGNEVFRTSTDGVTWTARVSGGTAGPGQVRFIQWTGGRLLAGGTSGGFWTSTDGVTWLGGEYIFTGAVWMSGAIAGNTRVMVGGHSHPTDLGDVAASAVDAEYWPDFPYSSGTKSAGTGMEIGSYYGGLSSVASTGSHFVAVVGFAASVNSLVIPPVSVTHVGTIMTSTDGTSWTTRATETGMRYVIWTGTQLTAMAANGATMTSTDGITWTPGLPSSGATSLNAFVRGNAWVAVGDNGSIVTAP